MKTAFTSFEYNIIFQSQMKFFEGNSLLVHANADDSDFPKPSNITVLREMYTTMQILQNHTLPKLLYHTKAIQHNCSPPDIHQTKVDLPYPSYYTIPKSSNITDLHEIFTKPQHTIYAYPTKDTLPYQSHPKNHSPPDIHKSTPHLSKNKNN